VPFLHFAVYRRNDTTKQPSSEGDAGAHLDKPFSDDSLSNLDALIKDSVEEFIR